MNPYEKLERLIILFKEFLKILEENKGQNYTRGIVGILGILTDRECSVEERLDEAKSSYKSMMGGMGTLGDFTIYPDGETKRKLAKQLDDIENEIWDLLDLNLSNLPDVDEGYPPGHPYWSIKDPKGDE